MRLPARLRPLACLLLPIAPAAAGAQAVARTPQVTASLVAGGEWMTPGWVLPVAVRLQVASGWYVYWHQPGEAGLPTTVTWSLPTGVRAWPMTFPVPERYEVAGLVTHVLRGDVVLVGQLAAQPESRGRQTVRATVRYGVCRDVCIPQQVELSLTLPVRDPPALTDSATRAFFVRAARRTAAPPRAGLRLLARHDGERTCVAISGTAWALEPLRADSLLFFPDSATPTPGAVAARPEARDGGFVLRFPPAAPPPRLTGLLVAPGAGSATVDVAVERGRCDGEAGVGRDEQSRN